MEQTKEQTKVPKHFRRMIDFQNKFSRLPDGAFFAVAEEHGIAVDDWVSLADWQAKTPGWERLASGAHGSEAQNRLHAYTLQKGEPTPKYEVEDLGGEQGSLRWRARCALDSLNTGVQGEPARTKKAAKESAAKAMLEQGGVLGNG